MTLCMQVAYAGVSVSGNQTLYHISVVQARGRAKSDFTYQLFKSQFCNRNIMSVMSPVQPHPHTALWVDVLVKYISEHRVASHPA